MAKYRKVDTKIWNDREFNELSPLGKLAFLFILTHPNMTPLGAMRATETGLASELGNGDAEGFREPFREAFLKPFIKHDPKACFLWLPNFLKYNRPENPNVVRSWISSWDLLPECDMKTELFEHLKAFVEGLPEGFRKGFREAFAKEYGKTGAGTGTGIKDTQPRNNI